MPTPEQIERAARKHDSVLRRILGYGLPWGRAAPDTRRDLCSAMRAALLAALPTPEEHERGIEAAAEAYREKTGEPGSATLRRNDDSDRRLCAAISAYLAAVGLAP